MKLIVYNGRNVAITTKVGMLNRIAKQTLISHFKGSNVEERSVGSFKTKLELLNKVNLHYHWDDFCLTVTRKLPSDHFSDRRVGEGNYWPCIGETDTGSQITILTSKNLFFYLIFFHLSLCFESFNLPRTHIPFVVSFFFFLTKLYTCAISLGRMKFPWTITTATNLCHAPIPTHFSLYTPGHARLSCTYGI